MTNGYKPIINWAGKNVAGSHSACYVIMCAGPELCEIL